MMLIRNEEFKDREKVFAVNSAAFETTNEANLVNALGEQANPIISLVAENSDGIIGHIMFSPVSLAGHPDIKIMGLGPMAVLPEFQHQGIGASLIKAGLDECRKLDVGTVVVLGHPEYYPKFGFSPAFHFGIDCEYEVPKEVFMLKELVSGFLDNVSGTIKYHEAFKNI